MAKRKRGYHWACERMLKIRIETKPTYLALIRVAAQMYGDGDAIKPYLMKMDFMHYLREAYRTHGTSVMDSLGLHSCQWVRVYRDHIRDAYQWVDKR